MKTATIAGIQHWNLVIARLSANSYKSILTATDLAECSKYVVSVYMCIYVYVYVYELVAVCLLNQLASNIVSVLAMRLQ